MDQGSLEVLDRLRERKGDVDLETLDALARLEERPLLRDRLVGLEVPRLGLRRGLGNLELFLPVVILLRRLAAPPGNSPL